jgi:hypothetical protein
MLQAQEAAAQQQEKWLQQRKQQRAAERGVDDDTEWDKELQAMGMRELVEQSAERTSQELRAGE